MDYRKYFVEAGESVTIPVYITNKNRLTPLRRLVTWLVNNPDVGKVTILDQGSTYEPLLKYHEGIAVSGVEVKVLPPNPHLCWAFWELGMHKEQTGPYIVTDGDFVPAEFCPRDIIAKMKATLESYYPKYVKVGPSLRIDNLPDSPWKDDAVSSQQKYWHARVSPDLFDAPIDTSFAIYMKDFGGNQGGGIRLDMPYVFEHYPWYVWPLDDEEKYYIAHDDYKHGHTSNLKAKGLV